MTNNQLTTERLEIMLAQTLGTTAARGEHASIEVTASIFISVLTEVLESRKTNKPLAHPTITNEQLDDEALQELIEFRRTTLEYHSKEGNKVQTIIHGVTLSALQELLERRKVNADLTMWVKRLGYSLKRAKPDSKLPGDAMTYLSAKGLISVEDVLR